MSDAGWEETNRASTGGPAYGGDAGGGFAPPGSVPGTETLSHGMPPHPNAHPPRRRGRAVAAAVATVVAVSGVSVGGYLTFSALSGGGDQPEAHLPASTVALAKIDMDPSAGQKIDAIRFANKFPGGKDLREDGDPRQWLWEKLTKDVDGAPGWASVQQWLGDRAAVAALPADGADEPVEPVLVLAVTDEAKAKADLSKLRRAGVALTREWAYVARTADIAQVALSAAQTAPLTQDSTFSADLDRLGEDGIATFWYDGAKLSRQLRELVRQNKLPAGASALDDPIQGHGAFALRFSGADLEFTGTVVGGSPLTPRARSAGVAALPGGTLAAVGAGGLGAAVSDYWPTALEQLKVATGGDPQAALDTVEARSGLALPDDLVALLGSTVAAGVIGPDGDGLPIFGARVTTSAADIPALLAKVETAAADAGVPVHTRTFGGGYAIASTGSYATQLSGTGDLGADAGFRSAVPDAAGATMVGYADIQGLVAAYGDTMTDRDKADLAPLKAAGVSITVADNGDATLRLKVTTR